MKLNRIEWAARLVLPGLCVSLMGTPVLAAEKTAEVPFSTPPGITLVDVMKIISFAAPQYLWRRLGDAHGKPLYTSDADASAGGKSTCYADCAVDFIPYVAPAGAVPFSDWTIVTRTDGVRQWAYQGQPLYSYTGKDPEGEPSNNGSIVTTSAEEQANKDPGSEVYSPKKGWKRAAYTPNNSFPTPPGIDLESLATANGYGLVDSTTKRVAYVMKNPPKNLKDWTPINAPYLAVPMGDFTALALEDGSRQWAYKGQRLYTFNGDFSPSDINGIRDVKDVQVALLCKHFLPAGLEINVYPGRGPLLVTRAGMSLYTQTRPQRADGRQTRDGFRHTYSSAKPVGTRGCVDECTKIWRPLAAPANGQAQGFWEVVDRPDGTKQWAFKGALLYTNVNDKKPGDIEGNNLYVIMFGDKDGLIDLSVTGGDVVGGEYRAGSALYWHLASLYN